MSKTPLIKSAEHVRAGRLAVFRPGNGLWYVARGALILDDFTTHAEAITFAQEQAKTEALKEPS